MTLLRQRVELTIGALTIQNLELTQQVEDLNAQLITANASIAGLSAELEAKTAPAANVGADAKASVAAIDGGVGPSPFTPDAG